MKKKRKCDTLRSAYDKLLKENNDFSKVVIDNATKYDLLESKKKVLEDKVDEKEDELDKAKNKRFSFGFTLGAIPTVRNEKVTVGGSIMVGLHYRIFSF